MEKIKTEEEMVVKNAITGRTTWSSDAEEKHERTENAIIQQEIIQENVIQQDSMSEHFHSRFTVFGTIAILIGVFFTACFYKAGIGISYPVFVLAAIVLIHRTVTFMSNRQKLLRHGIPYYIAAMLIAVSLVFTAKPFIQFFGSVGILLLLEASFLDLLLSAEGKRSFGKRLSEMFLLPLTAIGNIIFPFMDSFKFFKKTRAFRNEKVRQILVGILIAIPLLALVLALLAGADMIFSKLTETAFSSLFRTADPLLILLLVLFIFIAAYSIMSAAAFLYDQRKQSFLNTLSGDRQMNVQGAETRKPAKSLTAVTVTSLLTVVYLVFSVIQIVYLFGGGQVALPKGYTYAEYARQGFFQLLAVTVLNVLIVLICMNSAKKSLPLRIILVIMTACTYIMIASAGMRMYLYISAYDLSFLRILVLWFLVVNTCIITGAMVTIFKQGFPLFRFCIAVVSVCFITLSFFRPDYWIAVYNTDNGSILNKTDISYLTELSADAAPVLIPMIADYQTSTAKASQNTVEADWNERTVRECLSAYIRSQYTAYKETDFRGFHYAKYRAAQLAEDYLDLTSANTAGIFLLNKSSMDIYEISLSSDRETGGIINADGSEIGRTPVYIEQPYSLEDGVIEITVRDREGSAILTKAVSQNAFEKGTITLVLNDRGYGEGYYFTMEEK